MTFCDKPHSGRFLVHGLCWWQHLSTSLSVHLPTRAYSIYEVPTIIIIKNNTNHHISSELTWPGNNCDLIYWLWIFPPMMRIIPRITAIYHIFQRFRLETRHRDLSTIYELYIWLLFTGANMILMCATQQRAGCGISHALTGQTR